MLKSTINKVKIVGIAVIPPRNQRGFVRAIKHPSEGVAVLEVCEASESQLEAVELEIEVALDDNRRPRRGPSTRRGGDE